MSPERSLSGGLQGPNEARFLICRRIQWPILTCPVDRATDTKFGLHISDKPTEKIFKTAVVLERDFRIPAGAPEFAAKKILSIKKSVTLYAINPHMHFRGKFMEFEAVYSDGRREMLLSVPNYNFNWQRTYVFKEPRKLPKETQVHIRNAWDNSANNPYNPNPKKEIRWGEQSFDEMFFATLGYIED